MSDIDPRALRTAFGTYLTGVTVVTATGPDGQPVGFTANSFSSVSLDPPLLLVCPAKSLGSFPVYEAATHFAVNILAEGQEAVSNTFASFKGDRFAQVGWKPDSNGCPLINGAAATFSCAIHQRIDAGDHAILIGRVEAFERTEAPGLGYGGGGYFSLGLERKVDSATKPGHKAIAGVIVEHAGGILLQETPNGLRPVQIELQGRTGVRAALTGYLAKAGLTAELGSVYSIFEDRGTGETFTYFRATAASDHTGNLGSFMPVDTLPSQHFASAALAVMLKRYAYESQSDAFGLYIGDEVDGDVHETGKE